MSIESYRRKQRNILLKVIFGGIAAIAAGCAPVYGLYLFWSWCMVQIGVSTALAGWVGLAKIITTLAIISFGGVATLVVAALCFMGVAALVVAWLD